MSKTFWKRVDYYKNIAEHLDSIMFREDFTDSNSYLEKKKLETLIIMKVLENFNIDVSQYTIPCIVRKPDAEGNCRKFGNEEDMSLLNDFAEFYLNFVWEIYVKLGWNVNIKVIDNDILNCIDYENEGINVEYTNYYLGDDAYSDFPDEVEAIIDIYGSEIIVTHFFLFQNKRLGEFLIYADNHPRIKRTKLFKNITSCVEILSTPLDAEYIDNLQNGTLMRNGSFGICYYLFYNNYGESYEVNACNIILSNLIHACILNILLDEAYKKYPINKRQI